MDICLDTDFLYIILIIKVLLNIIKIVVPIGLIIFSMISLLKIVIMSDDKNLNQIKHVIINRFIAATIIFFVPSIISFSLDLIGEGNYEENNCWVNANKEYIDNHKDDVKYIVKDNQTFDKIKEITSVKKSSESTYTDTSVTYNYEDSKYYEYTYGNLNELKNGVNNGRSLIVKDGIFYMPNIRATSNAQTPYQEGTMGLNKLFSDLLNKMINDAKKEGYTIKITSAQRTYESQLSIWNSSSHSCPERLNWVACPGGSAHNFGIAADLEFDGTSCGGGWDCNDAAKWAHLHAKDYGLIFRLSNEAWHIEPINRKGANFGSCQTKC